MFCSAPANWHTKDQNVCVGDGGEEGKRWRGERLTSVHATNDVPGSASDSRGLARIHTEASFKRLDGRGVMPRLCQDGPWAIFNNTNEPLPRTTPLFCPSIYFALVVSVARDIGHFVHILTLAIFAPFRVFLLTLALSQHCAPSHLPQSSRRHRSGATVKMAASHNVRDRHRHTRPPRPPLTPPP